MEDEKKKIYWAMKLQKEWGRYQRYMDIAWGKESNAGQKMSARTELPLIEARMVRFRELSGSVV
jgi:hypothetical protein